MKKALVLILTLLLALSGCNLLETKSITNENIDVYFATKGNGGLDIEQRGIQYINNDEKYTKALDELIKGPGDAAKFEKNISSQVKILGTSLEQDKLTVNLSKEFNTFGGVMQEAAVIASVVNTMVQFPEVNSVRILVEGKEMIAASGNPYGYMGEIDFNPNGQGQLQGREVTLYFSDEQAMYVIAEKRNINIVENPSKEVLIKALIEEMIKGPQSEGLDPTIPPEARVNTVVVAGERATIDFSEEMFTKHWRGAAGEDMTLASIANTVTEVEGIREVVLTLEGQPLNIEHAIIDSSNPLVRMEDRILKK